MPATHTTGLLLLANLLVAAVVILYILSTVRWRSRTRGRPLPPGPRPLPIVGNMFNMPRSRQWIGYRDLSRELGDVIHFRVLGQSIVVLGSADTILDYLDNRSANTSDRVQSPMIELTGSSSALGFMPYGLRWRRHRRAFWQHFHKDAVKEYHSTHRTATHIFLEMLLDNPSRLDKLIRFNFASTILKVVYGIDIKDENDVYLEISEEAVVGATEGLVPGKFLVEFFPFLRYIPPWLPGATSQRLWAKWMAAVRRLEDVPFEHTKAKMEDGEATQSITAKLLRKMARGGKVSPEDERTIKNVGAVAFEAGIDTVLCALLGMFLGVSQHPEIVKKAQAELDAVVGPHRLPDFEDRDSLPYVNAIIKESMRWHTALPVGFPHANVADDELRGYFIPAGTLLIPNTWACMNDPEVYEEPDVFRPERFIRDGKLDTSVRDPADFVFGYGRRHVSLALHLFRRIVKLMGEKFRICPGRHFAEDTVFISVACALHVFDIGRPLGNDGRPIKVEHVQSDTLISYPEDSRCTIQPKSAEAEALIRSCAEEARSQSKVDA